MTPTGAMAGAPILMATNPTYSRGPYWMIGCHAKLEKKRKSVVGCWFCVSNTNHTPYSMAGANRGRTNRSHQRKNRMHIYLHKYIYPIYARATTAVARGRLFEEVRPLNQHVKILLQRKKILKSVGGSSVARQMKPGGQLHIYIHGPYIAILRLGL